MTGRGWNFCVIGGLAVARWGEPRATLDADLTLVTGWGNEEPYVRTLLANFPARIADAAAFALARRILLIKATNGVDIDIALGALPFEEEMVRRAVAQRFAPGLSLPCCTAEDLIVMKAFADRPRDWLDVQGIVARQSNLDRPYILAHLAMLSELKEAPEIVQRAQRMLEGLD
ncbi:MAG: nucleotidyl transferase AbiEii/AbiGii toxin family protein [Candidatus Competibacteraceae bacterium]|nr:nucleotidyl transferase AbiEii/AbiGii toxin family protein [Candidatus Competibacteraceae bacterium]